MKMSEINVGDTLTWLCTPREGYGFSYPVDAFVSRICKKRVRIAVIRKSGELVYRYVKPENLAKKDACHGRNRYTLDCGTGKDTDTKATTSDFPHAEVAP